MRAVALLPLLLLALAAALPVLAWWNTRLWWLLLLVPAVLVPYALGARALRRR